jgi:hypothetical protein
LSKSGQTTFDHTLCPTFISIEGVELKRIYEGTEMAKALHLCCLLVPITGFRISYQPNGSHSFDGVRLASLSPEPEGYVYLELDCGFELLTRQEQKEFPFKFPIYFVPTTYNATQVSGIAVVSGLSFREGMKVPDKITYRRVGTLRIIRRKDRRFHNSYEKSFKSIPFIIDQWVRWLNDVSVFAPSKDWNQVGRKIGLIRLV